MAVRAARRAAVEFLHSQLHRERKPAHDRAKRDLIPRRPLLPMLTSSNLPPPDLLESLRRASARLGPLGHRVIWFETITSTNDVASWLADREAAEGCLVIADTQTAGRGRVGRTWSSPPGGGIYASVLLRPPAHAVPLVTIAAGVALAEGIAAASGLRPSVKWPNDIYVEVPAVSSGGRKLAGILAESGSGPGGQHVIVGFGVNLRAATHPADVAARATAIEVEVNRPVDRGLVLVECLAHLWERYQQLRGHKAARVVAAWRRHAAATLGRRVEWESAGVVCQGTVENIDETGALMVRTAAGLVRVISGDVRWV
jgi:BirA family transcriptional regulator, biotin operon repressor / biotin---[acetyl-CoA-carboxylase] ligase